MNHCIVDFIYKHYGFVAQGLPEYGESVVKFFATCQPFTSNLIVLQNTGVMCMSDQIVCRVWSLLIMTTQLVFASLS